MLRLAIGLELLLEQRRVLRDEPPRHLEDLPRAAPVPVEHDRLGDVEVGAEAVEDGGVGAGPGEDGLLVVADREAVAVLCGQAGHDFVLGQAQVLELVHQDAVPAGPELRARLGIAADQLAGEPDQVVVVHQVAGAERLAIGAEQLEVARRERDVLQPVAAEQGEQLTDPLAPHPEPAEEAGLVVLVRDAEPTAKPGRCRILAQDRETERVERAAGDLLGGGAECDAEPFGDLVGGLGGKGDGADAPRLEPVPADEVLDAGDEAERLAGSRPGDDQHRAGRGFDGAELGGRRREGHGCCKISVGERHRQHPPVGRSIPSAGGTRASIHREEIRGCTRAGPGARSPGPTWRSPCRPAPSRTAGAASKPWPWHRRRCRR